MNVFKLLFSSFIVVFATLAMPVQALTIFGPNSYQSFAADSAFSGVDFSGGYFHLENFEDGLLNTPGVSANTGFVTSSGFSGPIIDSVDEDDGAVDGQCNNGVPGQAFIDCDSYFAGSGTVGIVFTFAAGALGALPTHAGIVWTDGAFGSQPLIDIFGPGGVLLGTSTPVAVGGTGNSDQDVVEDTFIGAFDIGGISAIHIRHIGGGGIEVDHLQYGNQDVDGGGNGNVPLPSTLLLMMAALLGLAALRYRQA